MIDEDRRGSRQAEKSAAGWRESPVERARSRFGRFKLFVRSDKLVWFFFAVWAIAGWMTALALLGFHFIGGVTAAILPTFGFLPMFYILPLSIALRNPRAPREVLELMDLPQTIPQYPVEISIVSEGIEIGRDQGVLSFTSGYLNFQGRRTTFSFSGRDVHPDRISSSINLRTRGLRYGVGWILHGQHYRLLIRPYDSNPSLRIGTKLAAADQAANDRFRELTKVAEDLKAGKGKISNRSEFERDSAASAVRTRGTWSSLTTVASPPSDPVTACYVAISEWYQSASKEYYERSSGSTLLPPSIPTSAVNFSAQTAPKFWGIALIGAAITIVIGAIRSSILFQAQVVRESGRVGTGHAPSSFLDNPKLIEFQLLEILGLAFLSLVSVIALIGFVYSVWRRSKISRMVARQRSWSEALDSAILTESAGLNSQGEMFSSEPGSRAEVEDHDILRPHI